MTARIRRVSDEPSQALSDKQRLLQSRANHVIFFYCANEGLSLLENAAHIGLPVPEKLKGILEQMHDREDKEGK